MRWYHLSCLTLALGCGEAPQAKQPNVKPTTTVEATPLQSSLLQPLVLTQKPTAISVVDALKRPAGEKVIVSGQFPLENVKPFNSAVAAFIMLSPEALAREEVKDELACDDAATCPSCRKLLDAHGVRVELVDQSGVILPTTVEGFNQLKPGGTITVEGEIKRDGKDNKLVRIVAKRFFPG